MKEIENSIRNLKYKKDEQIRLWSSVSKYLSKEEKSEIVKDLIKDEVFGYLDVIAEILFELVEQQDEFIQLLESLHKIIKNDLAAGPFYNLLIKIGEMSGKSIGFFEFIQKNSTDTDFKVISGLILGGFGKVQEELIIRYLRTRLDNPTKEEVLAFIRTIMVIYKDKEIATKAIEVLEEIYKFKDYNIYPDYINLATDLFNLNNDFLLAKIKDMLSKKDNNVNYVLFRNLTYQRLNLSDRELVSLLDLARDSNEQVIDEILLVLRNKEVFNEKIGELLIYWINKDINPRNFDWVLEELAKQNEIIVNFFFSNYKKINHWEFKFIHLVEAFVKANPKVVLQNAKRINSLVNIRLVLKIFRVIIGFIYKSKNYYSLLNDIYVEIKPMAEVKGYIDKRLIKSLDKKDFEREYNLCVDELFELIDQLLVRKASYNFKKIRTNLKKYPAVFDYASDLINSCEKNKEYSPFLWLGENEEPKINEPKEKELLIEKALRQSYNRSQYWPRAYLGEIDYWFNIMLNIENEKYQLLSNKKYKEIVINNLKDENSFWNYFSELCIFNRLNRASILEKVEPSRNQKQLDALFSLNKRKMFFEITNPKMNRKVTLDFGAVTIGNKALSIIQKKLQQSYGFIEKEEPLMLAIDISSSTIDEYHILDALHGSLGVTLQFNKGGKFVSQYSSRNDDSIAKKFKNHSLLSAIVIFKKVFVFRDNFKPEIVLQGNIYRNPHAENKISDQELKVLNDVLFK